jgi:predicted aspartyl protease
MGIVKITVAISNLAKTKNGFEDIFLVDTGAIECMAPSGKLKKAGILPEGKAIYELANGAVVEYEYGFAGVSFLGHETVAQIIFGPEGIEPILGVVALENAQVMVDPISRTLKSVPSKHLKYINCKQ